MHYVLQFDISVDSSLGTTDLMCFSYIVYCVYTVPVTMSMAMHVYVHTLFHHVYQVNIKTINRVTK